MADDLIFRAGTGAKVQITSDLVIDRCVVPTRFHVFGGPFPVTKGEGVVAVLINAHIVRELFLLSFFSVSHIRCGSRIFFEHLRHLFRIVAVRCSCKAGRGKGSHHQDACHESCHHSLNTHFLCPPHY